MGWTATPDPRDHTGSQLSLLSDTSGCSLPLPPTTQMLRLPDAPVLEFGPKPLANATSVPSSDQLGASS